MLRFLIIYAVFGIGFVFGPIAKAAEIFFDDFENADAIGVVVPDTPPVGGNWVTRNLGSVDSNIAANPESEAGNSSPLVYHMLRPDPRTTTVAIMLAPISAADTALVAANKKATIELKYYEPAAPSVGNDGNFGFNMIANEAQAVPGTLPVNSSVGISSINGVLNQTGHGNVTGVSITPDAWHDLRFDLDFTAKNFTLTVNGVAPPAPISFTDATATTLTHLWLSYPGNGAEYFIDDLRITSVPEPSTCALAALSLLGIVVSSRRARTRNM